MFTFGVVDWHSYDFFFLLLFKLNVCVCAMARAENSHYSVQHTDYWIEIVIVMHPGISINVCNISLRSLWRCCCGTQRHAPRHGMVRVALVKMVLLSMICIIYELLIFVLVCADGKIYFLIQGA